MGEGCCPSSANLHQCDETVVTHCEVCDEAKGFARGLCNSHHGRLNGHAILVRISCMTVKLLTRARPLKPLLQHITTFLHGAGISVQGWAMQLKLTAQCWTGTVWELS